MGDQFGSLPNPSSISDLPTFSLGTGSRPVFTAPTGANRSHQPGPPPIPATSTLHMAVGRAGSIHDPTAALPQKLVSRILGLEFVEMSELTTDVWHDESHATPDGAGIRRRARHPPVTDIMTWLEGFARMAAILCTKFPDKAPELWAYQSTILRAARNYEGGAWVAYDRQFRREALARGDLNWSALDPRLYNEAFTGRARSIPRCQHCLSEAHGSAACPVNPDPLPLCHLAQVPAAPAAHLSATGNQGNTRREICRNYNEGRCKFPHCKYAHICKECYSPHPWIVCNSNPSPLPPKQRSRSPRRLQRRGVQL